jgi:MFS family permease
MPAFLAAAFALSGADLGAASERSAWSTAFMHLVGAGAAFSIGSLSDRLGRRRVLVAVAALAAALTLSVGWMIALPPLLLVGLAVAQAFTTIGDSPVLTTALTEATPPGALGAVLAVRSLFGFGAGAAAPLAAGMVLDIAHAHSAAPAAAWGLAFGLLGLGGLGAAICAARLRDGRRAA